MNQSPTYGSWPSAVSCWPRLAGLAGAIVAKRARSSAHALPAGPRDNRLPLLTNICSNQPPATDPQHLPLPTTPYLRGHAGPPFERLTKGLLARPLGCYQKRPTTCPQTLSRLSSAYTHGRIAPLPLHPLSLRVTTSLQTKLPSAFVDFRLALLAVTRASWRHTFPTLPPRPSIVFSSKLPVWPATSPGAASHRTVPPFLPAPVSFH